MKTEKGHGGRGGILRPLLGSLLLLLVGPGCQGGGCSAPVPQTLDGMEIVDDGVAQDVRFRLEGRWEAADERPVADAELTDSASESSDGQLDGSEPVQDVAVWSGCPETFDQDDCPPFLTPQSFEYDWIRTYESKESTTLIISPADLQNSSGGYFLTGKVRELSLDGTTVVPENPAAPGEPYGLLARFHDSGELVWKRRFWTQDDTGQVSVRRVSGASTEGVRLVPIRYSTQELYVDDSLLVAHDEDAEESRVGVAYFDDSGDSVSFLELPIGAQLPVNATGENGSFRFVWCSEEYERVDFDGEKNWVKNCTLQERSAQGEILCTSPEMVGRISWTGLTEDTDGGAVVILDTRTDFEMNGGFIPLQDAQVMFVVVSLTSDGQSSWSQVIRFTHHFTSFFGPLIAEGRVFVGGSFSGFLSVGSTSNLTADENGAAFVAALSLGDGSVHWVAPLAGSYPTGCHMSMGWAGEFTTIHASMSPAGPVLDMNSACCQHGTKKLWFSRFNDAGAVHSVDILGEGKLWAGAYRMLDGGLLLRASCGLDACSLGETYMPPELVEYVHTTFARLRPK